MPTADRSHRYVEEFFRSDGDVFNGFTADAPTDWWPAAMRSMVYHATRTVDSNNQLRGPTILWGDSRDTYPISRALPVLSHMRGLYRNVRIDVAPNQNGLVFPHFSWTSSTGTYFPGSSYDSLLGLDPLVAPFRDYALFEPTVENIRVQGSGTGNRGMVILTDGVSLRSCAVAGFGWHGIDVGNFETAYTFSAGGSNVTIEDCRIENVGYAPGTRADYVNNVYNPTGFTGYGSGLRVRGRGGRALYVDGIRMRDCAYAGVHVTATVDAFLSRVFIDFSSIHNTRVYTQLEANVFAAASAFMGYTQNTVTSPFDNYGVAVGSTPRFAVIDDLPGAHRLYDGVASNRGDALVWGSTCEFRATRLPVRSNSTRTTNTISTTGAVVFRPQQGLEGVGRAVAAPKFELGSVNGTIYAEDPGESGLPYYHKYVPFPSAGAPSPSDPPTSGTIRHDYGNADSLIAFLKGLPGWRWRGRAMAHGRVAYPEGLILGRTHLIVMSSDPTQTNANLQQVPGTTIPIAPGDIALWDGRDSLSSGDAVLYVCVGSAGNLSWEPRF